MAASGFFTYRDLYAGKPEYYHHQSNFRLSSSKTDQSLSESDIADDIFPITTVVSSTTVQSYSKLQNFIQIVPFAYFHWFLIGLALFLTLLLAIIFICYCRSHCRKKNKSYKEKKRSLPNFYRYRTSNRPVPTYDFTEAKVPTPPPPFPSPPRKYPSKSVERLNNQLLRQGLDAVGSPQVLRTDVSRTAPSSTFSSTASDLLTEIKSRFSTHSSESSLKSAPTYETQRAKMALNDESKNGSLLIDMN